MSFVKTLLSLSLLCPVLAHAATARIQLNNGDSITGDVISDQNGYVTVQHPIIGELKLNKTNITSIISADNEPAEAEKVPVEKQAAVEPEVIDDGLFGTGLLTDWKRRFDLGIAGSAGKTRNRQVNAGFTADVESEYTRISHQTAYYRADSEGDKTDSKFFSSINRDWLRPDTPWFQFAGGRFDLDEFKDWDYRVNANGGIGYEFYNTEKFLFLGRSGLGFNQTFGGEREEFTPEALLGLETRWDLSAYQQIKFANTLYPSLKDSSDYRNLTSFDWILDLNTLAGVALKIGLLNEYDSATEEGISKNDFKYTVSLAWTL